MNPATETITEPKATAQKKGKATAEEKDAKKQAAAEAKAAKKQAAAEAKAAEKEKASQVVRVIEPEFKCDPDADVEIRVLTPEEGIRLRSLEDTIGGGFGGPWVVPDSLREIRDSKLFAGKYKNFNSYIADLGHKKLTREHAWRLVVSSYGKAKIVEAGLPEPRNESSLRPLLKGKKPGDPLIADLYKSAVEIAKATGRKLPTARDCEQAVTGKPPEKTVIGQHRPGAAPKPVQATTDDLLSSTASYVKSVVARLVQLGKSPEEAESLVLVRIAEATAKTPETLPIGNNPEPAHQADHSVDKTPDVETPDETLASGQDESQAPEEPPVFKVGDVVERVASKSLLKSFPKGVIPAEPGREYRVTAIGGQGRVTVQEFEGNTPRWKNDLYYTSKGVRWGDTGEDNPETIRVATEASVVNPEED